MPVYRGVLNRVGAGTWKGGYTTASLFQLGDLTLHEVTYSDYLDNFISDALSHSGEVAILLARKKVIVAIKIGDRLYFDEKCKISKLAFQFFLMFAAGILTLPILLAGLVFIYGSLQIMSALLDIKRGMPEIEAITLT